MNKQSGSLHVFYLLWSTQSLSQLGSQLTSFALSLWLFEATGSALQTALLMVSYYIPYVGLSLFAGAWSDRWPLKRTMLVFDSLNALCSVAVGLLLWAGVLQPVWLYVLAACNGICNTFQSPASDVALTLITPREAYQKISGLRSFSSSVITFLSPMLAAMLYGAGGMLLVLAVDLATFALAFFCLAFRIPIPAREKTVQEPFFASMAEGFAWLQRNPLILWLMLFLAFVNLLASLFDAALPAYILPHPGGGSGVYGMVCSAAGLAMIAGSALSAILPPVKNRVRLIVLSMLFALTTDNFLLPFSSLPAVWMAAQFLGYFPVPVMNTNLDVVLRSSIPESLQGRVYSVRNALQFFTIPLGLFLGGWLCDDVFQPLLESQQAQSGFLSLFGQGSWSGAGFLIFLCGAAAVSGCLVFGLILKKHEGKQPV